MGPRYFLGVDIGGSSAKHALVDSKGSITREGAFPTNSGDTLEAFLDRLFRVIDDARFVGIDGVGISTLGIVEPRTGTVLAGAENLPFLMGQSLKRLVARRYPDLRIRVANDIKAALRGELWLGAAVNSRSAFMLAFGTGLGGAYLLGSRIVEGAHLRAGEVGYTSSSLPGVSLEQRTSTKNLVTRARGVLGLPEVDGPEFFRRVGQGDPICLSLLEEWTQEVSRFVADLILILDLEKVIIGGAVSAQGEGLVSRLRVAVDQRLPPEFHGQCTIVAAQFGNAAGLLGAVYPLVKLYRVRTQIGLEE